MECVVLLKETDPHQGDVIQCDVKQRSLTEAAAT